MAFVVFEQCYAINNCHELVAFACACGIIGRQKYKLTQNITFLTYEITKLNNTLLKDTSYGKS